MWHSLAPLYITGQIMGAISYVKCASIGRNIHDLEQLIQVFVLFFRQFKILLGLVCKLYLALHTSRAALRSSILV